MKSEQPSIFLAERAPIKVTILVFSGSSIMCVASAVDPLRAANRICGETMFDWTTVSLDGSAPVTTSGLPVAVSGAFDASEKTDMLVVIGGFGTRYEISVSRYYRIFCFLQSLSYPLRRYTRKIKDINVGYSQIIEE